MKLAEVQYVDGNVNSPVLVHRDDPLNSDNVLVTRLGGSESVPKETVTELNEYVVSDEALAASQTPEDKDAEIAALKKQLADAEGNG